MNLRRSPSRSVEAVLRRAVALGLPVAVGLASPAALAASVKDRVRSHLNDELEGQEDRPPPKKAPPKRKAPKKRKKQDSRGSSTGSAGGFVSEPESQPEPEVPEKRVPYRVIGKDLKLDPKISAGYRGWYMQQYPSVDVAAQSYFTWSLEAKAKLFGLISLHRGYYESNGLSGPRRDGAVVVSQIGRHTPKAAWLLATIGVPINRAWEPVLNYETRAFKTSAEPKSPVFVLPHDADPNTEIPSNTDVGSTSRVELVSSFETLVIAVRYSHSKDAGVVTSSTKQKIPAFYLGAGLLAYGKPYQVSVGDAVLDDILFDARFRGAGLAFGMDMKSRPNAFYVDVDGQTGLGEVRLLSDLTLNELLPRAESRQALQPPKWLIGYVTGNVSVGYLLPIMETAPTPMIGLEATGGGATFFYFKTQAEEGETVDAPPLNWDFLWGAHAYFMLPL